MSHIIIVHRYDNPDQFGLHSSEPELGSSLKPGVFTAKGLYTRSSLEHELMAYENKGLRPVNLPTEDLIPVAPIEWHSAMRSGELLDRFTAYEITTEENNNV